VFHECLRMQEHGFCRNPILYNSWKGGINASVFPGILLKCVADWTSCVHSHDGCYKTTDIQNEVCRSVVSRILLTCFCLEDRDSLFLRTQVTIHQIMQCHRPDHSVIRHDNENVTSHIRWGTFAVKHAAGDAWTCSYAFYFTHSVLSTHNESVLIK
jgi:hypothetical protein